MREAHLNHVPDALDRQHSKVHSTTLEVKREFLGVATSLYPTVVGSNAAIVKHAYRPYEGRRDLSFNVTIPSFLASGRPGSIMMHLY